VNLVVDINIVFSTLLNPYSIIGEILMNVQDDVVFFAPDLLKEELKRYSNKIMTYTKLSQENLAVIETLVLSSIHFVSEELISDKSWLKALELTRDIDEDDTPFIALGLELNAKLWTGDKVLSSGIAKKNQDIIISTKELEQLLNKNK